MRPTKSIDYHGDVESNDVFPSREASMLSTITENSESSSTLLTGSEPESISRRLRKLTVPKIILTPPSDIQIKRSDLSTSDREELTGKITSRRVFQSKKEPQRRQETNNGIISSQRRKLPVPKIILTPSSDMQIKRSDLSTREELTGNITSRKVFQNQKEPLCKLETNNQSEPIDRSTTSSRQRKSTVPKIILTPPSDIQIKRSDLSTRSDREELTGNIASRRVYQSHKEPPQKQETNNGIERIDSISPLRKKLPVPKIILTPPSDVQIKRSELSTRDREELTGNVVSARKVQVDGKPLTELETDKRNAKTASSKETNLTVTVPSTVSVASSAVKPSLDTTETYQTENKTPNSSNISLVPRSNVRQLTTFYEKIIAQNASNKNTSQR